MNCLPDCQPAWIARNLRIRYGLNAGDLGRKSSVIEWHLIHAIWRGAEVTKPAVPWAATPYPKYENNDKRTHRKPTIPLPYFHQRQGIPCSQMLSLVSSSVQWPWPPEDGAHGAIRGGTNINNVPLSWPDSFFCLVAEERRGAHSHSHRQRQLDREGRIARVARWLDCLESLSSINYRAPLIGGPQVAVNAAGKLRQKW